MKAVLLVEDLPHVAQWVSHSVALAFENAAITFASTLAEGHEALNNNQFDLALIDIGLPDGSGMELLIRLTAEQKNCLNVMSTIFDDDQHVFSALRQGAQGYILKDQSKKGLSQMLQGINSGHYPISPTIANKLLHFFQPIKVPHLLTNRETEVLTLVAKGLTVPKVAEMLSIKPSTCYGYVKDIYRKLNINSRSEATLEAAKLGLISTSNN